jgi:pyruvate dehydrogenase E1 component beta subunit
MAKLNMVQALNLALDQEMEADKNVIVLGEDVGVDGGVFRVTQGLIEKYGAQRVIDTPLAECAIVGTSIGMALAGLKPVSEIQFDGFSYLIMAQMEGHASRFRTRSFGQLSVPMVVRMPYGGGVRALEHHSESREAYYGHTPGLKTITPSGPRNARALMVAAIRDPDPVIFMEPKRVYRAFKEEVPDEVEVGEIGKAQIVSEGTDITVVTWGSMLHPVKEALELLGSKRQVSVELIDLLTVHPMDAASFTESVKKTGRCVVVSEAVHSFGVASEVIAHINDHSLMYLKAPVRRVTNYDVVTPYFAREMMYIPSPRRIRRAIEETLDF